jgi:penicillin-binding protein 1C
LQQGRIVNADRRHRRWILIGLVALALVGGAWFASLVAGLPGPDAALARSAVPSTLILDRNGRVLYEVVDPEGGKHTPLPLKSFPMACRSATVATEDAAFFQHFGIDLRAILRSAWVNWRSGETVSGASTITQQVARMLLLNPDERHERSLRRKLREAWLAVRLEQRFSKDEILALYLNQSYYGHFAYGMGAAAQAYFGKDVGELDLAECAMLAGLPQYPAGYNPLENEEAAKQRQATVLELMVRHGALSRAEAARAQMERLQYAAAPFAIEAPHFVMYVVDQLERELGSAVLRSGGLRVYTTLDLSWQRQAEGIVAYRLQQLANDPDAPPNRRIDNAAVVAIDPATGAVLAMVGSPDYFDPQISGAVNGALSLRQPGSAIKPLTYAVALDPAKASAAGRPVFTAATILADVRTSFLTREGVSYVPQNYDLRHHGAVLLRQAFGSSFNIPAVKVLDHIGVDSLVLQAHEMGISSLRAPDQYGLALTLGGGEVALLELASAYADFARGGTAVAPLVIVKVVGNDGGELDGMWSTAPMPIQVLSPQVAYLVTDILSDDHARMAAFGEGSVLRLTRPAAVKTGTTTDWRDNWTVGYTPQLVVGVWVGNADNQPMSGVSGVDGAAPIWHDVMELLLRDQPAVAFARPAGLVDVEICADSGLLPNEHCPRHRTELFIAGTEPQETCTMHQLVRLDRSTGQLAAEDTPAAEVVERLYFILPAELQDWARSEGVPQPPASVVAQTRGSEQSIVAVPSRASCIETQDSCLYITSPDPAAQFRIRSGHPRAAQRIEVAARAASGVAPAEVTLLVDGAPLGTFSQPPFSVWWTLQPGVHEFQAAGVDADGRRLASPPVRVTVTE